MKTNNKDILSLLGITVGPNRIRCVLLPLYALQNALTKKDDK
jgi:NifU-like protein involved in Fe-S cluster formation